MIHHYPQLTLIKKIAGIAAVITVLAAYFFLLNRVQYLPVYNPSAGVSEKIDSSRSPGSSITGNHIENFIRDSAKKKYDQFILYLKKYWRQPFLYYGLVFALGFYLILLMGLFSRYFNIYNMWGKTVKVGVTMLECLPHALLVLFFYSLFSNNVRWLPFILTFVYVAISIPFVYSMMEDEFALAKKEGRVENLLIDPLPDWKILWTFVRENIKSLFFIPLSILIGMMLYMDFCYSGVKIYLYEESPYRLFFGLWEVSNPHHPAYKMVIKQEIFVLLFLLIPLVLLFYFTLLQGKKR